MREHVLCEWEGGQRERERVFSVGFLFLICRISIWILDSRVATSLLRFSSIHSFPLRFPLVLKYISNSCLKVFILKFGILWGVSGQFQCTGIFSPAYRPHFPDASPVW